MKGRGEEVGGKNLERSYKVFAPYFKTIRKLGIRCESLDKEGHCTRQAEKKYTLRKPRLIYGKVTQRRGEHATKEVRNEDNERHGAQYLSFTRAFRVSSWERERVKGRETKREREKKRERGGEREREREKEREREREREREGGNGL